TSTYLADATEVIRVLSKDGLSRKLAAFTGARHLAPAPRPDSTTFVHQSVYSGVDCSHPSNQAVSARLERVESAYETVVLGLVHSYHRWLCCGPGVSSLLVLCVLRPGASSPYCSNRLSAHAVK